MKIMKLISKCSSKINSTLVDIAKYFIYKYQKYISPYLSHYSKCPYTPSCSNYMLQALEKYGIIKGGALGMYRILRCNPFTKGGYDPVP